MDHPSTSPAVRYVAVIGTAGRDRNSPLSQSLWLSMCHDLMNRLNSDDHVVSGGAAWADHLAIYAYINGAVGALTLHLPAPLVRNAQGRVMYQELEGMGVKTHAARTANYYHRRFSETIGYDTLEELFEVCQDPHVTVTEEPVSPGMGAFFARNKRVAQLANSVLAYTFDDGDAPVSGGTADTWKKLNIEPEQRQHVALLSLLSPQDRAIRTQSPRPVALRPTSRASTPVATPVVARPVKTAASTLRSPAPVAPVVATPAVPAIATRPVIKAAPAHANPVRPQFASVSKPSRPVALKQ